MTRSNDEVAVAGRDGTERRTRSQLRDIFEQAYTVAAPLLDPKQGLSAGGGSAHFLRVVLHDNFPKLQQQDISILSVSIERVFRERNKVASH